MSRRTRNTLVGQAQMRWLWRVQDGLCAYCRAPVEQPDKARAAGHINQDASPSRDHFIPYSQGGPNLRFNMLLAHRICNNRRDDGPAGPVATAMHQRVFAAWEAEQPQARRAA